MTNHALVADRATAAVAGQVRAELARAGHHANDLAMVLGVTAHTAGRRLSGATQFTAVEIIQISKWLDVDASIFMNPGSASVEAS